MLNPKVFNLGESVVSESLISDTSLSKQALSKILNTSRTTVWKYDKVAYWGIPDYKQEYPEFPEDLWVIKNSKHDRESALTQYQVWVISAIQICFKFYKKEDLVKKYIRENIFVFTRSRYEMRLRQLSEAAKATKIA